MKWILKGIALLVLVWISWQAVSATYDEVFPSVKLRYNHGYWLFDTFYNGSSEVEITSVRWELTGDYTRNGIPDFVATEWLLDKTTKVHDWIWAKVIPAYGTWKILKTESNYDISYIPEERKDDNITVLYTIEYRKKVWGVYEYKTHTEFKPYEITWCGDWIKDSVYEQCDWTDWISDGQTCSSTCEIIDAPVPVCNSISPTTVTGGMLDNGSFTTWAISCDVSNSTGHTVTVNCGNGTTASNWTILYIYNYRELFSLLYD